MPDQPPNSDATSPSSSRRRLSRRARGVLRDLHQRTWELEFLMSGALAVALGQLPGRVDGAFNRALPLAGESAGFVLLLGYQYVKLILYTLILTFVLHIVLRAFWVSLIGLDSVFPRGVRWDRLKVGPVGTAYLRRHMPSVRELIVYTDGVASVLFAGAFYVVAIFLVSVVAVAVVAAPLLAFGALAPWAPSPATVLLWVAGGVSALLTVPPLLDRTLGSRVDPSGRLARWIRATHRFNLRRMGLAVYGPAQYTLMSQIGGGRGTALLLTVLVGITGTFIVRDILIQRERLEYGVFTFVPEVPGAAGVDPRYYESQWSGGPPPVPVPSIPTDALDDETAWVRLFVPFLSTSDPDAVAASCPDLPDVARSGFRIVRPERGVQTDTLDAAIAVSLRCASRLWDVALDGRDLATPPVFATHPVMGLPGLAWYVDVRDLPRGRHVLTVRRSATAYAADASDDHDPLPPRHHVIPFWR